MVRIELTTCCLRNSCSTTELHRRRRGIVAERAAEAVPHYADPSVPFTESAKEEKSWQSTSPSGEWPT